MRGDPSKKTTRKKRKLGVKMGRISPARPIQLPAPKKVGSKQDKDEAVEGSLFNQRTWDVWKEQRKNMRRFLPCLCRDDCGWMRCSNYSETIFALYQRSIPCGEETDRST